MATSWIVTLSIPVAVYLILSGVDDLAVDVLWAWYSFFHPAKAPTSDELERTPQKRIAIFVPCWHEHQVIEQMLSHNLAAIEYSKYTVFAGVYPNDTLTRQAVDRAANRLPDVRPCFVPHPGPTSKADCLNWIYQQMLVDEEAHGVRYDLVLTHDAEDMIHPQALRWINFYMQDADFVQIPVLALQTPMLAMTHGIYCDEFAEMHTRDLAVRASMGAFVPSAGVGTGYSRRALEALADQDSNQIFIPNALTEDYENGLRLNQLGFRQAFIPILKGDVDDTFVATREYFPQKFWSSVRQRTRWVTGIGLQSWARNGWCSDWKTRYWLWRDRKGLIGSPLGVLTNLLFVAACLSPRQELASLAAPVQMLFAVTTILGAYRIVFRMGCVMRVYGGAMAAMVPVRIMWANWINGLATVRALATYIPARLRGHELSWTKTTHEYPTRAALLGQTRRLGDILVQSGLVARERIDEAMRNKGEFVRLGEHLTRTGAIGEQQIYDALGLQQQLPVVPPGPLSIPRKVARALPFHVMRDWKVIPFRIDEQGLHLCTPEPPAAEFNALVERHTRLPVRLHLMPASRFAALSTEVLEAPAPQPQPAQAALVLSAGD